jgi:peptide deformylase
MIRPILRYGAPLLHRRADPVVAVDADTHALVDDLLETVRHARGIGLAAPQVGILQRVCVLDLSPDGRPGGPLILIHPEFVARDGLQLELEGCLSLPGFEATVARPARVTLTHLDREGRTQTIEGSGLLARAIQHEVDHLNGVLFVDRLRPISRRLILRTIEQRRRKGAW